MDAALFTCDLAGNLGAEIPDADGELHSYALSLIRPGEPREPLWAEVRELLRERHVPGINPEWACLLRRLDTDAAHLVIRLGACKWLCQCSDWTYRSRKLYESCKHVRFARAFHALVRVLNQSPQPRRIVG